MPLPGSLTYQVQGQGEQQQEQPQVKVAAVGELALLRVVVPAAGERSPNALPEQLQHLGHHACCGQGQAAPGCRSAIRSCQVSLQPLPPRSQGDTAPASAAATTPATSFRPTTEARSVFQRRPADRGAGAGCSRRAGGRHVRGKKDIPTMLGGGGSEDAS